MKAQWARCVYVGPGDGRNMEFLAFFLPAENEVCAWTDPFRSVENPGFCWLGSADEFKRDFRLV